MTQDTINKIGNAIAGFSDPFQMVFDEIFMEPIWRPSPRSVDPPDAVRDAAQVEFDLYGRHILLNYEATLARGADPDASFMHCARELASAIDGNGDLTFGMIQYLVNKPQALCYAGCFEKYTESPASENGRNEKKVEDWFLASDSPRHRFKNCHCLMNDETTKRAVREYRKYGTNEVFKKGRWGDVSWRRLVFLMTGDRYSVAWYGKFQAMAAELAGHLGLYPIEFLFCDGL